MLALAEWRSHRCPACGGDSRQCQGPDAEGRFEAPEPQRCHATTALVIVQKAYTESPQPEALLWRVKRR